MRRNYASLNLLALGACDAAPLDEDLDVGAMARLSLDADHDAYAFACVGLPVELMHAVDAPQTHVRQAQRTASPPIPTTPNRAVPVPTLSPPVKITPGLPSIRPAPTEPVRCSFSSVLSATPPSGKLGASLSTSSSSSGMRVDPRLLRSSVTDRMAVPSPLVSLQRNVIQSV